MTNLMDKEFNPHVLMFSDLSNSPQELWDKTLGGFILSFSLLGLIGSTLALKYFWSTGRNDLVTQLYLTISLIDICTCVFQLPATAALLREREPFLFDNVSFCYTWTILFDFLNKFSMYLVLLLSLTRAIVIAKPFYKIKKRLVQLGLVAYSIYLVSHNIFMLFLSFEAVYGADCAYCYLYFENGEGSVTDSSQSLFLVLEYIVMSLEYGLPPIITFFTFVVCIIKLQTRSGSANSTRYQNTAAVTVTIFTALFLVCNCPLFILIILTASYVLTHFGYYSVEAGVFSNIFMSWYSWPISRLGLTVVNASLNPLVYYWRMPGFRKWIKNGCKL